MKGLTDKELLRFVKENLTIGKLSSGEIVLADVLCDVRGNVFGEIQKLHFASSPETRRRMLSRQIVKVQCHKCGGKKVQEIKA